jgi:hypothetical protein
MLAAVGFFDVPKTAEKVWRGADWSSERNRDPTFSGVTARKGYPADKRQLSQ